MANTKYSFDYEVFENINQLPEDFAALVNKARAVAETAYAPYSNFFVGAAALLQNGEIVTGTNQENASYPVGLCAERSLLATAATLYPNTGIEVMAISYHNNNGNSSSPISPCGMCRQSLLEFENRTHKHIMLILSGLEGKIFVIQKSSDLLPLGFENDDLKK